MRRYAAAILLTILGIAPALAICNPPPGLPIQQWYSLCGADLQQAYMQGGPQLGIPFQTFVQSMYGSYMRYAAAPMGGMPMGRPTYSAPTTGSFQCAIGSTQCFSGYLRTCQPMPTGGSWWITGATECR